MYTGVGLNDLSTLCLYGVTHLMWAESCDSLPSAIDFFHFLCSGFILATAYNIYSFLLLDNIASHGYGTFYLSIYQLTEVRVFSFELSWVTPEPWARGSEAPWLCFLSSWLWAGLMLSHIDPGWQAALQEGCSICCILARNAWGFHFLHVIGDATTQRWDQY